MGSFHKMSEITLSEDPLTANLIKLARSGRIQLHIDERITNITKTKKVKLLSNLPWQERLRVLCSHSAGHAAGVPMYPWDFRRPRHIQCCHNQPQQCRVFSVKVVNVNRDDFHTS